MYHGHHGLEQRESCICNFGVSTLRSTPTIYRHLSIIDFVGGLEGWLVLSSAEPVSCFANMVI